jgi:hypothetical protein
MTKREDIVKRFSGEAVVMFLKALKTMQAPRELIEHKAEIVLTIPEQVEDLVGRIFDASQPPVPAPKPSANGPAQPAPQPVRKP